MKTNTNKNADRAGKDRRAPRTRTSPWSQVQDVLLTVLNLHGVAADVVDARTGRFLAVPVGATFSKARSNVLLHKMLSQDAGAFVFVDMDLQYQGNDPMQTRAFSGGCCKAWRRLLLPPVRGDIDRVLCTVLEFLGSPIARQARAAVESIRQEKDVGDPAGPDRMLAAVGELVTPELAAEAYEKTFRKELAVQLAVVTTRPEPPQSAIVFGRPGCGKDTLMLAATHVLFEEQRIARAIRISGGKVGAGSIFTAEMDAALLRLLTEAQDQENCLFLVRDLDVCLSGSQISYSLLCDAMDHDVRLLASIRSETALSRLASDEALARRVLALRISEPSRGDVADALKRIAQSGPVEVAPAAIQAVLRLSRDRPQNAGEPAFSIGLLTAAICQALWKGGQVDPDTVFSLPHSEWPQEES